MSFKISKNHDRAFRKVSPKVEKVEGVETVEETVLVVDEETGEIKEEVQKVERSYTKEESKEKPTKQSQKVFGLTMKNISRDSFM